MVGDYPRRWAGNRRSVVLVGTQDPDERLDVDEIARLPVGEVGAEESRECEQLLVRGPLRIGPVVEVEAVALRRSARDERLQHDVAARSGDEPEARERGPGQYPRLMPG